jgi:hypothetical protein
VIGFQLDPSRDLWRGCNSDRSRGFSRAFSVDFSGPWQKFRAAGCSTSEVERWDAEQKL